MKMKHKRIWAFWLAVVFCFTAAFYNAPLSLKAAEQENTSEEEIFNDVIIEETNEELPDEETDEELSKDDTSEEISDEPSEQEQTDEEDVNENAKDDNVVDTEDNTSEEDELTENEPLTTSEEENVLELEEETEILLAALPVPDGLYVAEYVSVPSDTQGSGFRIKSGSDPNYSEMAWCFDHGKTRPAIGTPVTKISANDYVGNDDSKYRKVAKALVYLGCFGNTAEAVAVIL